jgi:hypothetical protein
MFKNKKRPIVKNGGWKRGKGKILGVKLGISREREAKYVEMRWIRRRTFSPE